MTLLLIVIIGGVWVLVSGVLLVSVSMMSSIANRTELLTEDQLPHRSDQIEQPTESPSAPGLRAPTS